MYSIWLPHGLPSYILNCYFHDSTLHILLTSNLCLSLDCIDTLTDYMKGDSDWIIWIKMFLGFECSRECETACPHWSVVIQYLAK